MWSTSFLAVPWVLWKERNSKCFEGKAANVDSRIGSLKFIIASWMMVLQQFQNYSKDQIMLKWKEAALVMMDCKFFWVSSIFCATFVFGLGEGLLFFLSSFWVALSCQCSSPILLLFYNESNHSKNIYFFYV
eukprot:TRINITY_DN72265_c0_g1_i1.p1 TRINITY_DN72265_c0_g1~~TRINITY_DN72265_c0_g1_i1.p1  ORF type:complete len:132 (+),score=14.77 TRINITY_DN72265_c0_g1_i1:307-702(+)